MDQRGDLTNSMLCVTFLVSNSAGSIKQYHTQTQTLAQKKKGYFFLCFFIYFSPFFSLSYSSFLMYILYYNGNSSL
jgi:hypothetical protein